VREPVSGLFLGADRCDLAGFAQGIAGHHGTEDLIDHHREEDDVADHGSAATAQGLGRDDHSQSHACLREQGDTQITLDGVAAVRGGCAEAGPKVFACASDDDVDNTYEDHGRVAEDR